MKIIAFIMALLVMSLSCLSCSESDAVNRDEIKYLEHSPDHQDDDHADNCSPFCNCGCCAGFSLNYSLPNFEITSIINRIVYSSFLSSPLVEVSIPFWQPPKIS